MSVIIGLVQPNKVFSQSHTQREYQDGFGLDKFIDRQWELKCIENSERFERDCTHGQNCQRINNCKCTPNWICDLYNKKRAQVQKDVSRNLARNVKRRIGYKPELGTELGTGQPRQQPNTKAYSNFESFAEEFFK